MVKFRDYYPPPSFMRSTTTASLVRDGYGTKLLIVHFSDFAHPGKRGAKFPALIKAEAVLGVRDYRTR